MSVYGGPNPVENGLFLVIDPANKKSVDFRGKSIINWDYWDTANTTAPRGYWNNGDGNSRVNDMTPFGNTDIVWDASNNDLASDADGGFNVGYFHVDTTQTYRYSTWIRRKVVGNGRTYHGCRGIDASDNYVSFTYRSNGAASTNPYFQDGINYDVWPSNTWVLMVGHIWPNGTSNGANHPDSGVFYANGSVVPNMTTYDWVWPNNIARASCRDYLYYSTNSSTNQQFYRPRMDIIDGYQPTLSQLLNGSYTGSNTLISAVSTTTVDHKGVSNYVPANNGHIALNYTEYGGSLTITSWPGSTDGYVTVEMVARVSNTSGPSGMMVGFTSYDVYHSGGLFGFNTAASDIYGISNATVNSLNLVGRQQIHWHHYTFVFGPTVGQSEIWVDGQKLTLSQQVGTTDLVSTRTFSSSFKIGGWNNDATYVPEMDLALCRGYARRLLINEIQQNYASVRGRMLG